MRLNPKSIERINNFTINHYELGEDNTSPSSIEIYMFDPLPIRTYISYPEFFTKRAERKQLPQFTYFIDKSSIWQMWRGGETIKLVVVEKKGFQNCLRLVKYLREAYNIPLENIVLNFSDEKFIYRLIKGGEYYG